MVSSTESLLVTLAKGNHFVRDRGDKAAKSDNNIIGYIFGYFDSFSVLLLIFF